MVDKYYYEFYLKIIIIITLTESILCAGCILSTLCVLTPLILKTHSYDIGTIILLILQIRKLRQAKVKWLYCLFYPKPGSTQIGSWAPSWHTSFRKLTVINLFSASLRCKSSTTQNCLLTFKIILPWFSASGCLALTYITASCHKDYRSLFFLWVSAN